MKKLISLFIICLLTLLYPLNVFASEIDLSNETVDSSVYEISSTPKPVDFDEKEYARATLKENHSKKLKDEVFGGGTESVVMAAASYTCWIRVATDEEFRLRYSDWQNRTYNYIEAADDAFITKYGINFFVAEYTTWNSPNLGYDSYEYHIMKLKDQVSTNGNDIVYGFAGFALSQEIGAAEVSGRYAMSFYGGYGTRVIQHEMSHIYGCLDHTGTANCIMWYNYTTPGVWCNSHATKIQSNASKW